MNNCNHQKKSMMEISFKLTVSSKSKSNLIPSSQETYFKRKNKLQEVDLLKIPKKTHKCPASAIAENNYLPEMRRELNNDFSAENQCPKCYQEFPKMLSLRYQECPKCYQECPKCYPCGIASNK